MDIFSNCSRSSLFHLPPHFKCLIQMWWRVEEDAAAAIVKHVHVILSKFNYPIYPHFDKFG